MHSTDDSIVIVGGQVCQQLNTQTRAPDRERITRIILLLGVLENGIGILGPLVAHIEVHAATYITQFLPGNSTPLILASCPSTADVSAKEQIGTTCAPDISMNLTQEAAMQLVLLAAVSVWVCVKMPMTGVCGGRALALRHSQPSRNINVFILGYYMVVANKNRDFCWFSHQALRTLNNIINSMLQIPTLAELHHLYPSWGYLLAVLALYLLYRHIFKGISFIINGTYNPAHKNLGRTLPSFPNGWYVVCRSDALQAGQSRPMDFAGENMVMFRSDKGQVYALEAYCKHLGAHLGIGGKVVNQKCIQCPFHGWLYDGDTGQCVDYNGKPAKLLCVEYNDDLCKEGKKLQWKKNTQTEATLRKYPTCQMNGYIYVWIHALPEHQKVPQYPMIDFGSVTKDLQFRARTVHNFNCHIQDIPENGADIFHFKYVHWEVVPKINFVTFMWEAKWRRADDPNIGQFFQHPAKYARDFKQMLFKKFIENYPSRQYLSVGYLDNYVRLPMFGNVFTFNVTIIQVGCSTVFIFLKSPIFTIVLVHYLQPYENNRLTVYHEGYTSKWLPYWASALAVRAEGSQVTSDMYLWDSKRFGRKVYFKQGEQADVYLKQWREWYSQHYQGCAAKHKDSVQW